MADIFTSLNAATAVGPGAPKTFDDLQANVTMQVVVTGAPTSFEVDLEVSLDGFNWVAVNNSTHTPWIGTLYPGAMNGMVVLAVRANLVALVGGTSPTVTAIIATEGK
jgi:hypothetical protein